jgi:hypothetical protein
VGGVSPPVEPHWQLRQQGRGCFGVQPGSTLGGVHGTDHKLNEVDSEDEGEDEHHEERSDASEQRCSDADDSSEDEGELEHHEEEKRPDASKYDGDRADAFARYSAARRRREQEGDDYDDIVAAHERPSAGIPGVRWI